MGIPHVLRRLGSTSIAKPGAGVSRANFGLGFFLDELNTLGKIFSLVAIFFLQATFALVMLCPAKGEGEGEEEAVNKL